MNHSRISGAEEALVGRAGFGMPTLDHPVGRTCVAVGHPEARTGSEPGGVVGAGVGWGWGGDISSVKGRDRGVVRQASRMCAVAGYFSRCSRGITRWSLRALSDGESLLLLRLR